MGEDRARAGFGGSSEEEGNICWGEMDEIWGAVIPNVLRLFPRANGGPTLNAERVKGQNWKWRRG